MRKTAKAMALLTAASMIMTAFTPVYAESTDTEDTAAVDWENGENIKAIKEKGVITVATGTYVPFEYRDDDDNIVGFDIDLAQYIADKLGVDMEVTDMEFQSIVPSIQNGEYDFSIAAMYKTDERCEVVDMSKSYCDSGMILAVKEDSEYADTVKSLADCDGLKVAVKEGATSYNVAQSFLDENPDVSYEIVQYKDTVGCVSDLLAGRVDVVVNDLLNQKILSQEYEGAKIVCDPFTHAENAIAVQKGKDENTDDTEGVLFSKKKEESCGISAEESEIDALGIMSTMSAYMSALGKEKRSVNTGMLAGNGTIRASVKGYASGKLSKEELHQVWKAVEEALSAGALGISLGIAYAPEFEYDRDGLVEALQPLKGTDIPITTHIRNEGDGILLALQEVISVAEELQIPLHVSHMKCIGRKNWGGTPVKILKLFDQAAERGVKVDFDLYPYLTGSTQLVHLLPPQFQEGGTDAICARLADPFCRKEITKVLKQPSDIFENIVELAGFDMIYASTLHTEKFGSFAGQSIAKIAEQFGQDPYDTLYDILLEERCQVTMLDTIASEEDMLYFLKDSRANLISDAIYPAGGKYHPRVYGAFPKLLTAYVRDKKIFSIEDAVYKMTAKPAQVLGLPLGTLEKGMPADINVFHLDQLSVHADFQNPNQYCTGFDYVLVGGEIAVAHDVWRNSKSGRIVRK